MAHWLSQEKAAQVARELLQLMERAPVDWLYGWYEFCYDELAPGIPAEDRKLQIMKRLQDIPPKIPRAAATKEALLSELARLLVHMHIGWLELIRGLLKGNQGNQTEDPRSPYWNVLVADSNDLICCPGLIEAGDKILCKMIGDVLDLPDTNRQARRQCLLDRWFIIWYQGQCGEDDMHTFDDYVLLCIQKVSRERLYGLSPSHVTGVMMPQVYLRKQCGPIYEVIEVQPGNDRAWRNDVHFVEAIRRCGFNV